MKKTDVDRIERSIDIDAPAERVWELASEPGWYINDGEYRRHRIDRHGGDNIVHDPVHGTFAIRTVELRAPRYAAFRWLGGGTGGDGDPAADSGPTTLVEFKITDRPGGGVVLSVTESGLSKLPGDDESRRRAYEGNSSGWDEELRVVKGRLDAA